ncbi:hypothetical protein EKO27_g11045 [Xylaria grammica]|uniref:non-reducing end alpha-L-arabinofuranosidase n=1 Tax=Xylaria grammica TaxID=363999 RepID=A0A439CPI8_9PEZI|nr:hypothetical protein EKO27_g11045 [Xylaria grammica]
MTTFTAIRGGETPLIEVDAAKRLSKIDPMTYGGFTEHMGRCIYGGIYDPGNPLSDASGFRKDVLEALRELDVPVIRYPGGNFCATYHWQDGVGPRDKRPSRPELAWLGTETNQFGTDEFMAWLSVLSEGLPEGKRVEPYMCLNMGTGTLDEALAWVEYCNGTRDTYYANLRRANGHPEPYRVKYWALGNEVWGPWQIEQMTAEDYAKKAFQWTKALRLLDPDIVLVLCGQDGTASWDHTVLQACVPVVDMHSIHVYTAAGTSHIKNVTAPLAAERAIRITASLIELARIERGVPGAEETYTLSDALAVAVWLNVFVRQSRYIGMANIAQTVNVISPLMTTPPRHRQAVHLVAAPPLLQVHARLDRRHPCAPAHVSAAVDEQGYVSLAVVNISETEDFDAELRGVAGKDVTVYTVNAPQATATNTEGKEEVSLAESTWKGEGGYKFPKHSFTMLRWKSS